MKFLKAPPATIAWVAYLLLVVGTVAYTTISSRQTDDKIAAAESRQIDRNKDAIACMSKTFQEFLTGNQELREVSARRDKAFLKWVLAMDDLVTLRAIRGIDQSEEVRRRAMASNTEVKKFVRASEDLREARKRYKLPDFEAECGHVIKVPEKAK